MTIHLRRSRRPSAAVLVTQDPHGDIHAERVAFAGVGVEAYAWLSPSRSQLSDTSEFMLTRTTSRSWSSNTP